MRRLALLALLALLAAPTPLRSGPSAAPTARDQGQNADRELAALRARLTAEKTTLAAVLRKQGGILDKMEAIRAQLARSQARLTRLEQERAIAEVESGELAGRMVEFDRRLADKRRDLARRLRARYFFGRRGLLRIWLEARDLADLSRRRKYLDALFRADTQKILDYRQLLAEWSAARAVLENQKRSLDGLSAVAREQRAEMESERQALASLLRSVEEERAAHESLLAELQARESSLRGVLAGLDSRKEPPAEGQVDFAGLAGRLCPPASGPIVSGFGPKVHPRFGTVVMQNGMEIGAAAGSPARAVAAGTVRFSDWFRGYGNLVIVDHGGGWYTLYAHLAESWVAVGERVGKGKALGAVGDTGSMSGPRLYFEVRHHQQPQDPAAWLGACAP